jgi:hypothetical protein
VDEERKAGQHSQLWTGQDQFGQPAASGLYFYRLEAKSILSERKFTSVKKMLLVK